MKEAESCQLIERICTARLAIAEEYAITGQYAEADALYRLTLEYAEQEGGKDSLTVAFVLLEMFHFYDDQGRKAEAKPLWDRLRLIVLAKAVKLYEL